MSEPAELSPDQWRRVNLLFDRMQDADDPLALASADPDPGVAAAAARVWRNAARAENEGFLANPIELIRPVESAWPPQFAPGQVLAGRFEIQRLVGSGGMGEVYLALDRGLQEPETVAIKTICRRLAADPAVRQRFLAEVQNARRVTHSNVCRINDLFEEGGLPFLSMQFLEGERLSSRIERPISRRDGRALALQLAEGLAAAHRAGILHCDFKPANVIVVGSARASRAVITDFGLARAFRAPGPGADVAAHSLRAGTLEYMAPELFTGVTPSVRTDIFAFGRVLGHLVPNDRLAERCAAADPNLRPASLEPVIRSLRGDLPRRLFFGAGIAASAAAATYKLAPSAPGLALAGRTRIVVSAFRAGDSALASTFRELLITALRQSTLLTVVGDERVRSLLKARKLPVAGSQDRAVLSSLGPEIALVVEGVLETAARGLRASLSVFSRDAGEPALNLTEQVGDSRNIVRLADQTALRLRREFGESGSVLRAGAGYTPLEKVTSANPEAVQCYFEGIRFYRNADTLRAIAKLDESIRLDPSFALAWLDRGIALAAADRMQDGLPSYRRAFDLRNNATDRERLWIETRYLSIVGDYDRAITSCRKLAALYPEEADIQRVTAYLWTRLGRPKDGLPYNRRSVELDSSNVNALSEWIANTAEANLADEALALFDRFRRDGVESTSLNWGAGVAQMVRGDYDGALDIYTKMGSQPERDRWARLLRCEPLILSGRFEEARTALASDLAWDVQNNEQDRRDIRRVWLGMLDWMFDSPADARRHIAALLQLTPTPVTLQRFREAGLLAWLIGVDAQIAQALDALRSIEAQWPSANTSGARAALEAVVSPVDRASVLLDTARGLRPDPLTLYTFARWRLAHDQLGPALDALVELDAQPGRIYRHFFPALYPLARIEQARCLTRMSRPADALRLYRWVVRNWAPAGNYGILAQVRHELHTLESNTRSGDKR